MTKKNEGAAIDLTDIKVVGTVDLTPTWKGVLPLLMFALTNGTDDGKRAAREELARMAEAADRWNASVKEGN